ncbi:amidohydrolase family protein [Salipaludibacillus daqingensis]|uniref:amidohydrolase family protein n=1 Tax=Salipaludibacillus daqingensis TaxID=3041001 RepID=UPI00247575D8|nr:amidohydrolase family protein [Salipaludibacillus daqingensis]
MYKTKQEVLDEYPELEISEFGDFVMNEKYVKSYEIIDFHCHMFAGLKALFPALLKKEKQDMNASFFKESCFPFSLKMFDLTQISFTRYPATLASSDGIQARKMLQLGGLVVRKATPERTWRDMQRNNISKAVVMQINPPNKNSAAEMNDIIQQNKQFLTFGAIHPQDENIEDKIGQYLNLDIKGWKLNPHVANYPIDDRATIQLIKRLAETNLPILSCSGVLKEEFMATRVLTKKQKMEQQLQQVSKFYAVLKEIPKTPFIFAHAAMFEIEDLIALMKKHPNTYTDISTQPAQNIKRLITEIGSSRLLFGTDYPFFNHAFSILSVLRSSTNEEDRTNIFSRNAKTLLNI